jgi:ribosomal protein S17E
LHPSHAYLARISHGAKKRTAFSSHKLLFNDNFSQNKKAVRCLQSVASNRSISSPWVHGK